LELLVVRDLFMTESADLADYVLPAASFLERTELHCHRVFQCVALSKKILSFPNCQDEYQFWHDLAHRLGFGKYFPWQNEAELNKWLLEPTGITIEELDKHPEGIDYKPLRYCKWKEKPIPTSSGKVELASAYLKNLGYPEIPEYEPPEYLNNPDSEYPFVLITGARKVLYYHSRFRNIPRFRIAIPAPEVEIHPLDAEKLEVGDGDTVKITSRIGSVEVQVRVMAENEILPGNLQVTHGWKEANINILTHDDILDPISGYPLLKGVQVKVEKK
jgi:anaerobic selenocysteine-containing dehydrogenase